jgi:hypothetical protein
MMAWWLAGLSLEPDDLLFLVVFFFAFLTLAFFELLLDVDLSILLLDIIAASYFILYIPGITHR